MRFGVLLRERAVSFHGCLFSLLIFHLYPLYVAQSVGEKEAWCHQLGPGTLGFDLRCSH